MKKIQSIIMGLCWLFVAVSSIRLIIHILTNDLETIGQALGLSPFVLFIFALLYLSGGLLWTETNKRLNDRLGDLKKTLGPKRPRLQAGGSLT